MAVIQKLNEGTRAWIEIDLNALAHNAREIRSVLPPECDIMAVVKADAYGHGVVKCAQRLRSAGVAVFAVATVTEGIELRERMEDCEILILVIRILKRQFFCIHTNSPSLWWTVFMRSLLMKQDIN